MVQAPPATQQTPGGSVFGHGSGSHVVYWGYQAVRPTHRKCGSNVQTPLRSQQAPDGGCTQRLGVQVIHPMVHVEVAGQFAGRVSEHSPFTLQHPPVGCGSGQGFLGRQVCQSGCQTSVESSQSAS
jgi:hypothetical protein